MTSNLRNWEVRGIRNSSALRRRVVAAPDREAAILAASKGRGFMLVRECVLCSDPEHDREMARRAFAEAQSLGLLPPPQVP